MLNGATNLGLGINALGFLILVIVGLPFERIEQPTFLDRYLRPFKAIGLAMMIVGFALFLTGIWLSVQAARN